MQAKHWMPGPGDWVCHFRQEKGADFYATEPACTVDTRLAAETAEPDHPQAGDLAWPHRDHPGFAEIPTLPAA